MKLVVSDLDGTLLNDDSEVSNETIEMIKRLKNQLQLKNIINNKYF